MCFKLYIAKPEKIIRNQNFKYENNFNIFLKRTFKENFNYWRDNYVYGWEDKGYQVYILWGGSFI